MILSADELSRGNGSYRLDVQHVTVLLQRAHTNQKGRSKKTFQEEGGTFLVAIVRDGYRRFKGITRTAGGADVAHL